MVETSWVLPFILLLWLISGVILVRTVFKIKSFFKERDAEDFIDTKMLNRHAVAFGCYLGSLIAFLLVYVLTLFDQSKGVIVVAVCFNLINIAFGSISLIYLCVILWNLGTNLQPETDHQQEQEEDYASVLAEDWDEDSQLQADIWNGFVRNAKGSEYFKVRRTTKTTLVDKMTSQKMIPQA